MDAKRNYVVETATNLVLSRPLSRVTVRDVAQEAGVGEATVYRYFSTKTSLIVACALKLQGEVSQYFLRESKPVDGYTKLVKFYASYVDLFAFRPELYRFLYEFDAFCVEQRVKGLDEYSDNLDVFRDAYLAAYREGVEDGSVRKIQNPELFYYTTTHAVLSLAKKLAVEGGIVRQDQLTDQIGEIRTLNETFLYSLRAKN
ncbi:MAG: TetR/AcrR family transcriptional regulator [Clostridia bacterium]|nr:TetR/AcrR family transcriptional regulator [Clostridia bacterium]